MADVNDLATGELDDVDAAILRAVGDAYANADPVPPRLVDRISFAITLDALLQAEIAQLERSSDLVGVRSASSDDSYSITFTTDSMTIMITVSVLSPDRARIDGWVAPGAQVTVELRRTDTTLSTTADEDGRFVFDDVARGFAQFLVRPVEADARPVITPAVEL